MASVLISYWQCLWLNWVYWFESSKEKSGQDMERRKHYIINTSIKFQDALTLVAHDGLFLNCLRYMWVGVLFCFFLLVWSTPRLWLDRLSQQLGGKPAFSNPLIASSLRMNIASFWCVCKIKSAKKEVGSIICSLALSFANQNYVYSPVLFHWLSCHLSY